MGFWCLDLSLLPQINLGTRMQSQCCALNQAPTFCREKSEELTFPFAPFPLAEDLLEFWIDLFRLLLVHCVGMAWSESSGKWELLPSSPSGILNSFGRNSRGRIRIKAIRACLAALGLKWIQFHLSAPRCGVSPINPIPGTSFGTAELPVGA